MDPFATTASSLDSPARAAADVTPNDFADLATTSRAIYVGTGGNLAVEMADGSAVTFAGVVAGSVLPLRVAKVRSTGTTAGGLIALW